MDYSDWKPFYQSILSRFHFSEADDIKSANYFSAAFGDFFKNNPEFNNNESAPALLKDKIAGKNIVICGNAPTLEAEYRLLQESRSIDGSEVYIAADGAAFVLLKNKKVPDIIVTDLDGKHPNDAIKEIEAADKGALLLIHAHGHNSDKLEKYLPAFKDKIKENAVIPTCQCRPPKYLFNFGGFTDGDRCLFLADAFDAASIVLIGFDFNDPDVPPLKKEKLKCAEKLIELIRQKNGNIMFFSELE